MFYLVRATIMLLSDFGIDERFFAHTRGSDKEMLSTHLNLTCNYYQKIVTCKNLEPLIDSIIHTIDSANAVLIKEMFENAIFLHDLGKKNPCFQAKKMLNPLFKEHLNCGDSSHSRTGALEYISYYRPTINQIKDDTSFYRLTYILYNFAYHIDKHHGYLGNIESYCSKTTKEQNDHPDFNNIKNNIDEYLDNKFEFYILNKLLFSLLVSSDYYATTDYIAGLPIDDFGVFSSSAKQRLNELFSTFTCKLENPVGINKLRIELFQEAEQNLLKNLDKNIFYLEAPTGSGKTITSINLALKLLESNEHINKLFYIFPFNTLVEQTKNVFDEIFKNKLTIEVINSITPISTKDQEEEETKYEKSYINRLFFHAPAIITTHVALFNILFGTSKEDNFPLWQLANSVIILDEIQSYNNHLWHYMVEFFDQYAALLNIKIIIMSATLPKLDYFLKEKNNFVDLISKEKREYFFTHTLFKDRVQADFTFLNETMTFEHLEEILKAQPKSKKILFEFIKKKSAREFYTRIKATYKNVYELSGDDNKAYRQLIINKSKEDMPLIIIATQVIEAGVDIDMDIGFKDISTLDSEEQFMGRINRSCKREGKVYFFNMDEASEIYCNDHRLNFDLTHEIYRDILANKSFGVYYQEVLAEIKKSSDRFENGLLTNYDNFTTLLKKLNYKEIAKTMTLISSNNFTLYFPFKIDIAQYKGVQEFAPKNLEERFLSDGYLDGQKVWDAFLALNEIDGFAKKEVAKSRINALMQFFTFTIFKNHEGQRPSIGDEMYGYYFVQEYGNFITSEGKFDREQYNAIKNSHFL
ncbi:CRISPR-associated helicase Cas3 [Sulfurospirillum multivorans DSM 12446]|uniref:CRISPR-associated helicase Cas3 n=3 Tax=Sulfurospirillum multivorans TaxID=66821 RepID=A0AA86AKE8_SULMK|nr:CRISPR-associated helicase Cas3 [Sulfurospirillum multivorans DSM 12446]